MAEQTLPSYQPFNSALRFKTRLSDVLKRLMDIGLSALGMLLLSPVFLLIAALIRRDSPGPIFYYGPRLGRYGRVFGILKFRTMYENPQSYAGPRITGKGDRRVTPIGRWLRDTKLNELPQLWNVLVGEMSLVGPRPEDPEIAKSWPQGIFQELVSVRPGLTSPASVLYRNEESLLAQGPLMDTYLNAVLPSKLRLDQLYVRHRSLLLDLDTLLWTFLVLLPRQGDTSPPEDLLFLGPLNRLIRRYLSWFMIDALVTFTAVSITGVLWRASGPLDVGVFNSFIAALGFAFLFSATGAILGANRISWARASASDVLDLLPPISLATAVAFVLNYLWMGDPLFPPAMILTATGLAAFGYVVVRYRARLLTGLTARWLSDRSGSQAARERVLVIGGGESGQFASWMLQNSRYAGLFHVVGYVDDDLYKQNTRIRGVNVLGRRADIARLVSQYDVGVILFAIHNIADEERQNLLDDCAATPARLLVMPDLLADLHAAIRTDRRPNGRILYMNGHPKANGSLPRSDVQTWLNELSDLSQGGDVEALQRRIQELREQIVSDKSGPPAAG